MIKSFSLQDIQKEFGGEIIPNQLVLEGRDLLIDSISTDTRAIKAGDLFVALSGDNYDAHDYLQEAVNCGAKGLVINECYRHLLTSLSSVESIIVWLVSDTVVALGQLAKYQRDFFNGILVSVTGSCGKTTVKGMLASIFIESLGKEKVFSTVGNFNNHIGVPLSLLAMNDESCAVIEMGASGPNEISYLTSIVRPNIVMVNNVMPAHVEGFGSIDGIAVAKGEIYQGLRGDDTAVINADSPYASLWLDNLAKASVDNITVEQYSVENNKAATMRASNIHRLKNGCYEFTIYRLNSAIDTSIQLSVLGVHNVSNALAAATCAYAAGVTIEDIKQGLANYKGDPGRLELVDYGQSFVLINDTYNASPGSVKVAIDTLTDISNDPVLVLGEMAELGEESSSLHAEIGRYAAEKNIARLFAIGEKTRAAVASFGCGAFHFSSIEDLVSDLIKTISSDTAVLVKGSRSARMETVIDRLKTVGEVTNARLAR